MNSWINWMKSTGRKLALSLQGRGFYLALTACLVMVGGAALYARGLPNAPAPDLPQTTTAPVIQTPQQVERLQNMGQAEAIQPIWPVAGRVLLKPYSKSEPQWSGALGQYELHTGIDIEAAPGEVVQAVLSGTVRSAYSDPLLGYCIELESDGGYVSRYANLASLQLVALGDRVAQGQAIGSVGTSAAAEADLAPHLHYELYKDNEWALADVEAAAAPHTEYEE